MAQPPLHLIIGNYNTSSWSLRAWLVLRLARLAFTETRIPLRRPETPERIGRYSPSGKLPVLLAEGVPIWDSLAIAEFVAELEPSIWPLDPIARAEARSICAEVHSGFAELRRLMPMDIVGRFNAPGRLPRGVAADMQRVMTIWEHCRARFAPQGPFLFGAFSITDAAMAPIATRLVTHGVPLAGAVEDYVDSLLAWPDMVTWCDAASAEHAEREATGSLAMVNVTRPGRVLGPETAVRSTAADEAGDPSPSEAAAEPKAGPENAAVPEKAAATENPATPGQTPHPAETPATAPATAPATGPLAATTASADARPQPSGDEGPPIAEPVPADAAGSADAAGPVSPPRRRLFEAGPPADADTVAASSGDASEAAPIRQAPAAATGRKLGWLRHTVPADHFDEPEPASQDGAGPGASAGAPDDGPRPGASEPPRSPAPGTRPGAPAIKPIGGGILRRR